MSDDLHALASRAGVPPAVAEHYGPLVALVGALLDERDRQTAAVELDLGSAGFDLWKSYAAGEAAEILGLKRRGSIYEIPEAELPRSRVGPARGSTTFLGLDLLVYMKGLSPVDWQAVRDRAEGLGPGRLPSVRPLGASAGRGRRRVL